MRRRVLLGWAVSESGEVAVTVTVKASERSAVAPTTIPISLPDPAVTTEILTGSNLARNFCTDLPDSSSNPTLRQPATAGRGVITLGPAAKPMACGTTEGTLRLDGLIAKDGTTFAPVEVTSAAIGCYSG
jgi:hypothetical protein